jgi:hydroxymethylpyrimidine pyrophosphatase-like HAD family hydrolase
MLFASDLDRTLIYSAKAMLLGEPVADPACIERHHEHESSFISPIALRGLAELSHQHPFVPTTTRTSSQYQRIHFQGVRIRHAITTNGGSLLVDGVRCRDWDDEVEKRLAASAPYGEAEQALADAFSRPWVRKIRNAEDRFTYTVFERKHVEPAWFDELDEIARGLGWSVSVQGRKAYVVPDSLTKEAALAEVVRRVGATTVAAAGDSLLDRGLLEYADVAIRPAHGELHDTDWQAPGLIVTRRAGGGAAEEIVDLFTDLARRFAEVPPVLPRNRDRPSPA